MATHHELVKHLRAVKREARSHKDYASISANIDHLLSLLASPGDKAAAKAQKAQRFVRGTTKTPRPKRITAQPLPSGQLPSDAGGEISERPMKSAK